VKNSYKELKYDELLARRAELKKSYFDLRFKAVVGHVDNPVQKRVLRRQIARIETLIHIADIAKGTGEAEVVAAGAPVKARSPRAAKPRAAK